MDPFIPYSLQTDTPEQLLEGRVLLMDKPFTWTSFDVVNKIKWQVRRSFGLSKFKIGHAGTLDPLATGLLVICTGKLTRSIQDIQSGEKEYTGTIFLGQTTASYDLETIPEGTFPTDHIDEELVRSTALSMTGEQEQRPPIFSAKWVDGQRAYVLARKGEHVEIPRQMIFIDTFEITRFDLPEVDFRIRCSKGTYIRSLAHEFGQRLGSGSYLKTLRRTASLPFTIDQALDLGLFLDELNKVKPQ